MKIVCISDIHRHYRDLRVPAGDVLVVAGDYSTFGTEDDCLRLGAWIGRLPHKHVVVGHGNHELFAEQYPERAKYTILQAANRRRVHVLLDDGAEIMGLRFWVSPWTPAYHDWAFNLPRGQALRDKWSLIPPETDVLVTHGPPFCVMDRNGDGEHVGCVDLRDRVWSVKPKLHVFGHIHEGYGRVDGETTYVNASRCNGRAEPAHDPIVVDVPTAKS